MIYTIEGALLLNLLLFAVLFLGQVGARTVAHGLKYSLSSLDAGVSSTVFEDRLQRITRNQLEFVVLFGLTVMLSIQSSVTISGELVIALSVTFGRALYVLMTSSGIPVLRSASWLIAFGAWGYLALQIVAA